MDMYKHEFHIIIIKIYMADYDKQILKFIYAKFKFRCKFNLKIYINLMILNKN